MFSVTDSGNGDDVDVEDDSCKHQADVSVSDKSISGECWIGAELQETDQEYHWLDGTRLSKADPIWKRPPSSSGKQCVFFGPGGSFRHLTDGPCTFDARVICQFFL